MGAQEEKAERYLLLSQGFSHTTIFSADNCQDLSSQYRNYTGTVSKKEFKFPIYNLKCRGKRDTTVHELFRVVSRFPRHISCNIY